MLFQQDKLIIIDFTIMKCNKQKEIASNHIWNHVVSVATFLSQYPFMSSVYIMYFF